MNDEARKYLRALEKMQPNLEVFAKMVQILKDEQKQTDKLFAIADHYLLETYKTLNT
jgi:hypothetical protein